MSHKKTLKKESTIQVPIEKDMSDKAFDRYFGDLPQDALNAFIRSSDIEEEIRTSFPYQTEAAFQYLFQNGAPELPWNGKREHERPAPATVLARFPLALQTLLTESELQYQTFKTAIDQIHPEKKRSEIVRRMNDLAMARLNAKAAYGKKFHKGHVVSYYRLRLAKWKEIMEQEKLRKKAVREKNRARKLARGPIGSRPDKSSKCPSNPK